MGLGAFIRKIKTRPSTGGHGSSRGEILETAEGWSLNRGTAADIAASAEVNRWLGTPEGKQAKKEVAQVLQDMWDRDRDARDGRGRRGQVLD